MIHLWNRGGVGCLLIACVCLTKEQIFQFLIIFSRAKVKVLVGGGVRQIEVNFIDTITFFLDNSSKEKCSSSHKPPPYTKENQPYASAYLLKSPPHTDL